MDGFFDFASLFDADLVAEDTWEAEETVAGDVIHTVAELEATPYLLKSADYWQQMPLPPSVNMDGTNLLASLDDDVLLSMSPSLIAHIQRTEASGGLQVISPRQVTLGGIAARTNETRRTTDMFLAGSSASRNMDWPTIGEPLPEGLFWREPIDSYPSEPAARPKTVSSGILSSTTGITDPITKAFLIGRAIIDLQRRPDVSGSPDDLALVLAACWGLDVEDYVSMGEASLAPAGDLLRYAIRSDSVYPVVNAPIQARKAISVGANTAGRLLYGEYCAIDWRRMRVLAESVFYQASRLEGYTLADMTTAQPPGNPRAPPDRPGILQMRPLPGSVWTFDPATFRVLVDPNVDVPLAVSLPERVAVAVAAYHESARPVARAVEAGVALSYTQSTIRNPVSDTAEALVAGFKTVLTANSAFSARGRTSAAAVRGFVYSCLADNPKLSAIRALWMTRYMSATAHELNLAHLLDARTTRQVAARMADLTLDMRTRLAVEASRRGADIEQWWKDLTSVLPAEIKGMAEGSGSWAVATAHMLIHPVTDKWGRLAGALAHSSHTTLARSHIRAIRLPARIGSAERTFEAARATARHLGASYGAYYTAMYDVSCVLSDRVARAGNKAGADRIKLAGLMWDIRAKAASTIVLHDEASSSTAAGVVHAKHGSYRLTTAPYNAYQRWASTLNASPTVARNIKMSYPHHAPGLVSTLFGDSRPPIFTPAVGTKSRLYRYIMDPKRLGDDIEKTLQEISQDIQEIVQFYDNELLDIPTIVPEAAAEPLVPLKLDMERFKPASGSYWDTITQLDSAVAVDLVDAVTKLDPAVAADIEGRAYSTPEELERTVWEIVDESSAAKLRVPDAVR